MDIKRWLAYRMKKMGPCDLMAVKTYCFLAGMIAGAYLWQSVQAYVWVFVVVILSIMLNIWMKIFAKKKR